MQNLEDLRTKFKRFRRDLRWFTPVGKSDHDLRKYIHKEPSTKFYKNYRKAYKKYRHTKRAEVSFRILLYAGLVTSIAASFGLEQLRVLQNIAAYIGVSVLFVLYGAASYFNLRAREDFYLRREIFFMEHLEDKISG